MGGGGGVPRGEGCRAVRFAVETVRRGRAPGGAAGWAAVLAWKVHTQGNAIGIIAAGGNVDATLFASILGEA